MRIFRVTPLVAALLSAFAAAAEPAPATPTTPAQATAAEPETTVTADQIDGIVNDRLHAEGNVVVVRGDQTIESDWLDYYQAKGRALAGDRVKLSRPTDTVIGRDLDYAMDDSRGVLFDADLTRTDSKLRGKGERVDMTGKDTYNIFRGRFTTCDPGRDDWYINARDIDLDYTTNVGTARNGYFEFQGVPILWTPYLDFPLSNERKSGLLMPTFRYDSGNGFDFTLPYYWNIAPNMDATLTPRLIANRGLQLGGEFRYLQPDYSGSIAAEVLDDRKTGDVRDYLSIRHNQKLTPELNLAINYNHASDSNYFRDLGSGRFAVADNINLLQDVSLYWNPGWGSWTLRAQKYQTLQDPAAPVDPPYQRMPQLLFTTAKDANIGLGTPLSLKFDSEFVSFAHPTKQEGERFIAYPSVSLPLTNSWGFVTPKFGVHYTDYSLNSRTGTDQEQGNESRTLPIVSLDSGMYFERPLNLFGRDMVQTLEPRLYYVNIPYRDQSKLPVFDTTENTFDFAQIFTENRFTGGDRINDANQVTFGATTRFLDPENGLERLRFGLAGRYSFIDQRVTLPGGTAPQKGLSDVLGTIGGDLNRRTSVEANYQWNNTLKEAERYSTGIRYSPDPDRVASLRYRYDRQVQVGSQVYENQRQIDLGVMWPIAPRWYGVARENYSLTDNTPLEHLAGVEYRAGCWAARFVVQHYVSSLNDTKTSYFFQLELAEFGRLGNNPLDALKLAIPGYTESNKNAILQ